MGRRAAVFVVSGAAVLLLSGCGTPPWEAAQPSGSATTSATPTASSGPSASSGPTASSSGPAADPTAAAVGGDLSRGALSRELRAGDLTVSVRYWSTVPMDRWTPGADKPLSMSVTAESSAGSEAVLVSATVDVSARDASGADLPDDLDPLRATSGTGFAVTTPQSWSNTFVIDALPERTRDLQALVTLVFRESSDGAVVQQATTDVLDVRLPAGRS